MGGVPGRAENGSRRPLGGVARLVWRVGIATTCGCLSGNAQPIVRLPAEAGVDAGAPLDGASSSACPADAPISLFYWDAQPAASANSIDFLFKIENTTGAAVPLSEFTVRYYFTNEIPTWQTSVYYAGECCGTTRAGFTADVAVTVNAVTPATPSADHYLEVSFDAGAGDLATGDSVQIEVGFYAPDHAQNVDQANDYSYIPGATGSQAQWDLCPTQCTQFESCVITVYENGNLVWGAPP